MKSLLQQLRNKVVFAGLITLSVMRELLGKRQFKCRIGCDSRRVLPQVIAQGQMLADLRGATDKGVQMMAALLRVFSAVFIKITPPGNAIFAFGDITQRC